MPRPESEFGRTPITIVELDQDRCSLEYGVAPCTAELGVTGTRKCFNTLATCQDTQNFDPEPLTLRFGMSHGDLPLSDTYIIPSVQSISTSPTRINVGGRQGRDKPLGRRADVRITLKDHPHGDNVVDPYVDERDYDPLTRGTFWSKWLRRNPFYTNRALRVLTGYAGQSLDEFQRREYRIERIDGPDSRGNVTIRAQDVLRLADNDKAQAPRISRGELLADLSDSATSMVVTGGALEQYNQGGTQAVRIGDEVIRYSSVSVDGAGDLVFTGLQRGSDNTEAQEHDEGDTVQACLEFDQAAPWDVAFELLTEYGNVPSEFIDFSQWQDEAGTWLSGLTVTRLITEPIGVTKLLGELSEQTLFFIWWDERAQLIPFRAVRPAVGDVPLITQDGNLLQNETSAEVRPEQRASEVWVTYLPRDPVTDRDERENFRRTSARVDETAASPIEYGERQVYEVYSRWLETEAQVDLLSFRLLARYRTPTAYLSFTLDAKDRDALSLGDAFDVEWKGFVDDTGAPRRVRYQIISEHENPPGERVQYEAQRFDFEIDARFGTWMVEGAPTYPNATEQERETGFWWGFEDGTVGVNEEGYTWT